MKSFVMKEIGRVGFMDKPVLRPGPGDAIVRTAAALICTSDSHTVQGRIGPRENLTLGHEGVGVVHEVGGEVQDFQPGDLVLVGAITPDWSCLASQNRFPSQSGAPLGGFKFANIKDGVFAEYFHVNDADANLARIPEGMERLLRMLETGRVDPTPMTTHTFSFDDMERAFEVADKKLEDVVKVPITF